MMLAAVEPTSLTEPEEPAATHYEFNAAFQTKVAALILRDCLFLQRTEGLIQPSYFENTIEARLVDMGLRYFERYKKNPDGVILASLIKRAEDSKVFKGEEMPVVRAKLVTLFTTDISDRDFVIDEVATFARHQALVRAMEESIHALDKKDFERIADKMSKALDVGVNHVSSGYDYGEMIDVRSEERLDRAAGKTPPTGISTGYDRLDRLMYHKGWGRRELSVLMGGPKAGKSTALIDFGLNAAGSINRYNVLYVTLEVAAKIIADRSDANISEVVMMELGVRIHEVKDKVKKFKERSGKFIIHEFPTGSMTVSDLRRLIEHYKARGTKFDLVVVDYADLMRPEKVTDNAIENSKSIYINLRGLAMEEDIALLTATQTNREGAKSTVITMNHVAEDFNKIRIADLVISINRTDEERAENRARLFFAASRNQASGITVSVEQAIDRMKFITTVLGEE